MPGMSVSGFAQSFLTTESRRRLVIVGTAVLTYILASIFLPDGLPVEVVVPGLVTGALTSFTAMGLVLIYRSSRVVNFAQANIGGVAVTLTVILTAVLGWSYWIAVPIGIVVAMAIAGYVERVLLGPLRDAPRLIVTVATIGVSQLLGGMALYIAGTEIDFFGLTVPAPFDVNSGASGVLPFRMPVSASFDLRSLIITSDYVFAVIAVPIVLLALVYYFNRTDSGIGARACADSGERATLLGIPVKRLSLITWMVAGAMSAFGAILVAGVAGFQASVPSGPEALIAPLAAAVIAGFDSLAIAFVASLGIGLVQRALIWNYGDPSLADLAMFIIIMGALLLRRKAASRVGGDDAGGFVGLAEARPLPEQVSQLKEVRALRIVGLSLVLFVTLVVPLWLNGGQLTFFAFTAIYVIIGASLLILTGWGGQVSLGQFGFVGLGAGATAFLLQGHQVSILLCLFASMAVGGLAALAIGIPAMRIRGIYLAVATLAFAAPASTFFLSSARFPAFTPVRVDPPILFSRFDLSQARPFYYFSVVLALFSLGVVRNFRRSRIGRAAVTLRDNERFAVAVSIPERRVRLSTFALSGALAGLAGALYVLALRGIPFGGFAPVFSLQVFTLVVIGGMGSVWGSVLGAVYLYGTQFFLGSSALLFTTGAGIVFILRVAPGGLADMGYGLRDRLIGRVLVRNGLSTNLLYSREDEAPTTKPPFKQRLLAKMPSRLQRSEPVSSGAPGEASEAVAMNGADTSVPSGLLTIDSVEAGYGFLQILFGISTDVQEGEVFALLGTNGAGKSTILKVVSGLLPASGGRIHFDGQDITDLSPAERVERGVVLVPGGRGVFTNLTVAENLRLAGWLARRRGDDEFIATTMDEIHDLFPILLDRADQKAGLMSGGEQQMLTIAQALLCRPKLLMIDELSLGLAPAIVGTLLDVIRRLNADGMTVILVEQSMNVAATIAPRAIFLEKGEVRFAGATAELASKEALVRSVFFAGDRPEAPDRAAEAAALNGSALPSSTKAGDGAERPIVLETRGLAKRFGGVTAVDGVDLTLREGSITGVIGANGAGKTTLFDVICGYVTPDSGEVLLHGTDVTAMTSSDRFAMGLGRTFQDLRLVPSLTVRETIAVAMERHIRVREPIASVLALPAALRSEAEIQYEVDHLIESLNLQRFANAFISELSTGTRRVVELAAVSAHRPSVLVLDEPSSGLAQKEAEAMVPALFDLRDRIGATIAIIEHDIPMIKRLSDEVVCMHLGGVLTRGTPDEVLSDPRVVSAYLGVDDAAVNRSSAGVTV